MKKLAVTLGLITSTILNMSVFPASAQKANDGSCSGGIGDKSIIKALNEQEQVISVGRKARRALGWIDFERINYLYQATCENEDRQIKFFNASLAIPDGNDLKKAQFIFYLDGQIVKKINIVQGAVASIAVDNLHKHSSYAYDIKGLDGNDYRRGNIHILKWQFTNRPK
ncbi:MAG: hypothetical protein WBB28_22340 [Crinalium sp.]